MPTHQIRSGRLRQALALILGVGLIAGAALPASGQSLIQRIFPRITGGGAAQPDNSGALTLDPKVFTTPGYCPEVRIPLNGETYAYYDADRAGEPAGVRFMGSILQTARECMTVTETGITMKLGIAGRVVAGPKGGAGKITLPVRITVVKQSTNKILFDKAYNVGVSINSSDLRADFAQVIEPVTFKRTVNDEDIILYVGFDHPQ